MQLQALLQVAINMSTHNPAAGLVFWTASVPIILPALAVVVSFVAAAPAVFESALGIGNRFNDFAKNVTPLPAVGLKNDTNICYMNSILQSLSSCDLFVTFVNQKVNVLRDFKRSEIAPRFPKPHLALQLKKLLNALNDSKQFGTIRRPKNFIYELTHELTQLRPLFDVHQQQDAHEFLDLLIDLFQRDVALIKKPSGIGAGNIDTDHFRGRFIEDPFRTFSLLPPSLLFRFSMPDFASLVKTPLHGTVSSSLQCKTCGWKKTPSDTPSICLSLSLSHQSKPNVYHIESLEHCLNAFLQEEDVDEVECDGCELCANGGVDDQSEKWAHIQTLQSKEYIEYYTVQQKQMPAASIASIEKGDVDEKQPEMGKAEGEGEARHNKDTGKRQKIKRQHIKCLSIKRGPQILCIHFNRRHYDQYEGESKLKQHVQFEEFLALPGLENKQYRLMSVIEHHGSFLGGHYSMYRRNTCVPLSRNKKKVTSGRGGTKEEEEEEEEEEEDQPKWTSISDHYCSGASWEDVSNCQAYMLFYQETTTAPFKFKQ